MGEPQNDQTSMATQPATSTGPSTKAVGGQVPPGVPTGGKAVRKRDGASPGNTAKPSGGARKASPAGKPKAEPAVSRGAGKSIAEKQTYFLVILAIIASVSMFYNNHYFGVGHIIGVAVGMYIGYLAGRHGAVRRRHG